MARLFDAGNTDSLDVDANPTSGRPFTMSCWWYPTDDTTQSEFLFLGKKDGVANWHAIGSRKDGSDFKLRARSAEGNVHAYVWGDIIVQNTWVHAAAAFVDETDVRLYTNGNRANGLGKEPVGVDRVSVGRLGDDSPSNWADGRVADVAFWNGLLTDTEHVSLAKGANPLTISPGSLVFYAPLIRGQNDWVGGLALTDNGSTIASHPPVMGYAPQFYLMPPSVSPPIDGEVVWGHDTGVLEANVRDFAGNWTGTGSIEGAGDAEVICLDAGEFMISEVVNTGTNTVTLLQNEYDITGDDVDLDYRHGATEAACLAAGWNDYAVPFVSLGYVQVRITSTL